MGGCKAWPGHRFCHTRSSLLWRMLHCEACFGLTTITHSPRTVGLALGIKMRSRPWSPSHPNAKQVKPR
ncbi:hypothetical protein MGG_15708 [Pyricularia oryzae 70-15]|uniref:Uncharacterized protein n=1 Tax=Pyricularia oryzae (strain 70-15 / ATCC MYA-4617 / FGSC 8958) TaxID=242507 RepID=G4MSL3_PYRO7|nr:uncharacterized protein MGG_15708 [Pyricularia oryzae 70-15]EHA54629.1 hypothetical protein MGG_15708 [Pyricularia oryzae 70-15]